jgi:hypothetical protein
MPPRRKATRRARKHGRYLEGREQRADAGVSKRVAGQRALQQADGVGPAHAELLQLPHDGAQRRGESARCRSLVREIQSAPQHTPQNMRVCARACTSIRTCLCMSGSGAVFHVLDTRTARYARASRYTRTEQKQQEQRALPDEIVSNQRDAVCEGVIERASSVEWQSCANGRPPLVGDRVALQIRLDFRERARSAGNRRQVAACTSQQEVLGAEIEFGVCSLVADRRIGGSAD